MLAEQSIVGQRVVLKKSNNLKRHTIMKKVKLTLHGGFHNVDPINVHISARDSCRCPQRHATRQS